MLIANHELLLMVNEAPPYLLSVKAVTFPFDVYTVLPLESIGLGFMADAWQMYSAPIKSNAALNKTLLRIASPHLIKIERQFCYQS
jgi:hypothetical protein